MQGTPSLINREAPALLRVAAIMAVAAGIGVWGAILPAPVPRESPPMLEVVDESGRDLSPVAQWFGGKPLRVRVVVQGVIAGQDGHGAALLSIDGAPPRAYRAGQALAPGVTLEEVTAAAVSIAQDGVLEQVAIPDNPFGKSHGFVPAEVAEE